jgi:mono/diheme cytochrome c family protein
MTARKKNSRQGRRLASASVFLSLVLSSFAPGLSAQVIEPDFPFSGLTLDVRQAGDDPLPDNLVPRGIILPLGHDTYACFDVDLLRIAVVWKADPGKKPIDYRSISSISYDEPHRKAEPGEGKQSTPQGRVLFATGLYPGVQAGDFEAEDPRPRGIDPEEIGRGPYEEFLAIHDRGLGEVAAIEYRVDATRILERIDAPTEDSVRRHFTFPEGVIAPLSIAVTGLGEGEKVESGDGTVRLARKSGVLLVTAVKGGMLAVEAGVLVVRVPEGTKELTLHYGNAPLPVPHPPVAGKPEERRWPTSESALLRARDDAPYVFDRIELPVLKRKVRPSGIDFLPDGRAVVCTIDGDVWLVSGLDGGTARWKRFASGLHEPQNVCVRDGEIFAYTRNGIEQLLDRDKNGEADDYRMFCNRFLQTADTRDFPHSMVLRPDGGFYLTRGGQMVDHLNDHGGRVLSVSPDGKDVRVFATGLRNAFLCCRDPDGLLTASDQQGNWVPATPVHRIEDGGYYGYRRGAPGGESAPEPPVHPPICWIPHREAQSALGHVWTRPEFGPLSESLLVLDYYRPSLLHVDVETGIALPLRFPVPIPVLKSATNPKDGMPYFAGFQIWGTASTTSGGLVRLRHTEKPALHPERIVYGNQGIVLRFNHSLDERASQPGAWDVQRWNYHRSADYGSGHFRLDDTPGQDYLAVRSVHLSKDHRSVFLDLPGLVPVMQMAVAWRASAAEPGIVPLSDTAYFTIEKLDALDLDAEGFPGIDFAALAAVAVANPTATPAAVPATTARGEQLYTLYGCLGCHSIDGTTEGKSGPTWKDLHRSQREFLDGGKAKADAAYLREAILDPQARVVKGYDPKDVGMPSYRGILSDSDVGSLVLFIQSLSDGKK